MYKTVNIKTQNINNFILLFHCNNTLPHWLKGEWHIRLLLHSTEHCWIEQHFFAISFIIEGATEKVLQFTMSCKSIYSKNLCFDEQKNVNINTTEWFKQWKIYELTLFLSRIFFLVTFSELPSIVMCRYYTKMRCSINYSDDETQKI